MKIWYKEGVFGELDPEALEGFRRLKRFWYVNQFGDLFITSIREGTHLPHSFHSSGRAFDIQPPSKDVKLEHLRRKLLPEMGEGWELYEELDHLHFELNWKD